MKIYTFLLIFFLILNCSNNKGVNWCGDHPCINKKEKEAYFKKTMVVEVKQLKRESYKDNSEIEKLLQQAQIDEKKRIIGEKELAKQAKLEEKRRIKEEKELAKQAKMEEERLIKNEKKVLSKKIVKDSKKLSNKSLESDTTEKDIKIELSEFDELVKKITMRNSSKPFPEINYTPN